MKTIEVLIELNDLLNACDAETIEDYYCSIADVYGSDDVNKAKTMFNNLSKNEQVECVNFLSSHMWYDVLDYDQLGDFNLFINDLMVN